MKKSIDIRPLVRQADKSVRKGYNVPLVATHQEFSAGHASDTLTVDCSDAIKNADNGRASVVGCNCNNSNASVRSVNGNNSAVNSNNNYCGGSALIYLGKSIMACPPRTNITDRHVGTAAHASCEYDLPPFCMSADMDSRKAESKADNVRELLAEIHEVNTHKRLKNLRRYITDKRIIAMAIDKMLDGKPHKKSGEYVNVEAQYFSDHTDEVAEIISNDLKNGTYRIGDHHDKFIPARWKHGKDRHAKVLHVYDQVVQITILIVCGERIKNELIRNIYSNVKERAIFSNNKTYSLKNQLSNYVTHHTDKFLLMTDISKFYDSLSSKIALAKMFELVTCNFTRSLLAEILLSLPCTPIGDSLSPTVANLVMSEVDKIVLFKFKPQFFAAFGDNRIYGGDKDTLYAIKHFVISYCAGRFNLNIKGDYQIVPCNKEFTFCKTIFKPRYTHIRASLKSHAIKIAHIQERFAGYKGYMIKTDSNHLLNKILSDMNDLRNRAGVKIPDFIGEKKSFDDLEGRTLLITNYERVENNKPSKYYYKFQFVDKDKKEVYCSSNGSEEIKNAMDHIHENNLSLPQSVTIKRLSGNKFYFDEYHTSLKEAFDIIANNLNI